MHAVSWNDGKDKLIVAVEDARTPETYYFLDRTTHQAMKSHRAYSYLTETDLGEVRSLPVQGARQSRHSGLSDLAARQGREEFACP